MGLTEPSQDPTWRVPLRKLEGSYGMVTYLRRIVLPPSTSSSWWKMNCDWRVYTSWQYNWSLFFPTTLPSPLAEPPASWQDRTQTIPEGWGKQTIFFNIFENNLQSGECSQKPPTNLLSRQRIWVGWFQGHRFPHSTFLVWILVGERLLSEELGFMVPQSRPLAEEPGVTLMQGTA